MTDAWTAGVSKDNTTSLFKDTDLTVAFDGGTDLLRTRGDSELALCLEAVVQSLLGDRSGAGHILIGRVCARTDQADLQFFRPVVLLDLGSELGQRSGKIWSEGTVDMGLELGQVLTMKMRNFYHDS